ncbi:MAG: hypothetical protein V7629_09485 [Motiliproteus sp.]
MIAIQQEQLRQQYLAAIGVTLWLPRRALPGAAASPTWRCQAARSGAGARLEAAVTDASADSSAPRPVANTAQIRELLPRPVEAGSAAALVHPSAVTAPPVSQAAAIAAELQSSATVETDARVKPGAEVVAQVKQGLESGLGPKVAASTVPRFRLAMIGYSNCMVVTELPTSQAQAWSGQHQQLLDAILTAVGLGDGSQASANVCEFKWPLDPLARFDQSAPIARHALQVAVAREQQAAHSVLLLMGSSAQQYLLPPEQDVAQGQLIDYQGRSALCCHGLNEVLRLPGLKAELWRQLQPLRKLPSEY